MALTQETRAWLEWLPTTSVPLHRLDANQLPASFASSCIVDYRGRRFLLSVEHAAKMHSRNYVLRLGYKPRVGQEVFHLRGFNYLGEVIKGSGSLRTVDLCFTELPLTVDPVYQFATPSGIMDERPRHIFQTNLDDHPTVEGVYAFAGEVKPERHGAEIFVSDTCVYPGLRYLRSENEYHVFKLPVRHPGHQEFFGCSGGPIVDKNRVVVALVCDGDEQTDIIRGVSISRYKFAIDFVCDGHHLMGVNP